MTPAVGDRLRWWQYIGPWEIRPWVVFWGVGAITLIAGWSARRQSFLDRPMLVFGESLLVAVAAAVSISGVLVLGMNAFPERTPRRLVTYLLFLLGACGIGTLVTGGITLAVGRMTVAELAFLPLQAARLWLWSVFLLAVFNMTVRRLSVQTQIAEAALAVSLAQQERMLINEERSRRQISALLHDRVQAGLMAACLELRLAAAGSGSVTQADLERIVARIDDIRGLDVRQAARALSPDLENVDLRTALTELARVYEPMTTEIVMDHAFAAVVHEIDRDVLLGIYRVAEQGLLNAVVHGHAGSCTVSVMRADGDRVTVIIRDSGHGSAGRPIKPGLGSAVIDAWCRVLDGIWTLEIDGAVGATLSVTFSMDMRSSVAADRLPREI